MTNGPPPAGPAMRCSECGAALRSPRSVARDNIRALFADGVISYELAREFWQDTYRDSDENFWHTCNKDTP